VRVKRKRSVKAQLQSRSYLLGCTLLGRKGRFKASKGQKLIPEKGRTRSVEREVEGEEGGGRARLMAKR